MLSLLVEDYCTRYLAAVNAHLLPCQYLLEIELFFVLGTY